MEGLVGFGVLYFRIGLLSNNSRISTMLDS
jgi:hypothetical protein